MKCNRVTQTNRRLTIYAKHFQRSGHNHICFPEIRLSGKWLQSFGFNSGKRIIVQPGKGRIIITTGNKKLKKNLYEDVKN